MPPKNAELLKKIDSLRKALVRADLLAGFAAAIDTMTLAVNKPDSVSESEIVSAFAIAKAALENAIKRKRPDQDDAKKQAQLHLENLKTIATSLGIQLDDLALAS